jgi:hypothetical protein
MVCNCQIDWGSLPDWIVALTAVFGVGFATRQISAFRKAEELSAVSNEQTARAHEESVVIARANILRSIDAEFESEEMYRSRKAVRAMRARAEAKVRKENPSISNEPLAALTAKEFSKQLSSLWEEAQKFDDEDVEAKSSRDRIAADRYAELMRLPNWFESLGHMIRRELLPKADLLEVYDAAIYPTMLNVSDHIKKRREDGPHPNPGFLEHAVWLGEETKKFMQDKRGGSAEPAADPSTPWR